MDRKKAGLGRDSFQTRRRLARTLPGPGRGPDQDSLISVIMGLVAPRAYPASIYYWSELSWEAHTSYHAGLVISRALQGRHTVRLCESWDGLCRSSRRPPAGGTPHSQAAGLSWRNICKVQVCACCKSTSGNTEDRTPCSSLWSGYLCYLLPMGSHPTSEISRQGPRLPWCWHFKVLSLRPLGRQFWVYNRQEGFSKIYKGTEK